MAICQEEEQAGKRVNLPRKHHGRRIVHALLAGCAALAMLITPISAQANDRDTVQRTEAGQSEQTLTIDQATAVVTESSGFHIKVTIANRGGQTSNAGKLTASINVLFTFVSRSDIQNWADGNASIPTPNVLGAADVPAIAPGGTATVSITAAKDQQALAEISTWGPKPLQLTYDTGDGDPATLNSFLTRSASGLNNAQTPPMSLTVAVPVTANAWQARAESVNDLIEEKDEQSQALLAPSTADASRIASVLDLASGKHQALQAIVDPRAMQGTASAQTATTLMQPGAFDITAYSDMQDAQAYSDAGAETDQWSADQARALAGDGDASVYAWQGAGAWTQDALNTARAQGYDTVIAHADFDAEPSDTVHTGTYQVDTPSGMITVLKEQSELTELAHGRSTSDAASAESSDAGRLARLLAQSAFYQMEQPYTPRNLLMTFASDSSPSWIDQVMTALEQAPWLTLTDLDAMANAEPYASGDSAHPDQQRAAQSVDKVRQTLQVLAGSRRDITRVATDVLKNSLDSKDVSALDPQALARQDADSTAKHSNDPNQWVASLLAAHDDIALVALSDHSHDAAQTARALADALLNHVEITPTEAVSVFSESAKMPVTVSNDLPYAVTVNITSITDSMQIVTSPSAQVTIPPHSDAQVAFTIRVSTSGSTTAHIALADRKGTPFGATQSTTISSVMRISDASGFIIIGFALLLGLLGLWRQFHRIKDPDE